MRVKRGCLSGGERRVFERSGAVAGLRRVMNYPCQLSFRAATEQSFQYEMVQALATRDSN